jgi:DNA polymerase-1
MAINAPAQGTQADVIKIAMVRIDEFLKREQLERDAYLVLQVHDELVYEVRTEKLEVIGMEAKRIMESVLTIEETKGVPIIADASCGPNWGEMEKF